ncbi:MAG: photosystem II biogenesis protein Psp29 [Hydrococcus sp. Prado102]|nr:photosystem II biogenesis protein Psp29 [Hydrococcus sp. Prado102]
MKITVSMSVCVVDKVRTVSDTKREFYTHHTRPIVSVYRRIVEELMVEMHLLSVNVDFKYDPIYALGVVTAFERFMQGYQPEKDKASIFAALCKAIGNDPEQYRQHAGNVLEQAKQMSVEELIAKIGSPAENAGNSLVETLQAIANRPDFKYSRLFAIGLYTVLAESNIELIKDKEKRDRTLQQISEALHFLPDKLQKDLDLYRSNLDKMDQLLGVLEEALQAEKKKRVQQETEGKNNSINDVKN